MQVRMVSLEDGITSCGFRKMAAYVAELNADTQACYVTTNRYRGIRNALLSTGALLLTISALGFGGYEWTHLDALGRSLVLRCLLGCGICYLFCGSTASGPSAPGFAANMAPGIV